MDVVEASHLEVIKQYLDTSDNQRLFKAQKTDGVWNLWLVENGAIVTDIYAHTFGEAAKQMSIYIAGGNNGSIG
jgi:hypothetical protein